VTFIAECTLRDSEGRDSGITLRTSYEYRWGYVKTNNPDEPDMVLREKLPEKYWKEINNLLVPYGQNLCMPLSPFCSKCRLAGFCERIGVNKSR
jgi:endonuclease-3